MREASTELLVELDPRSNVTGLVLEQLGRNPSHALYSRQGTTGWTDVSAQQFVLEVSALAKGLIAGGISAGDPVAILSSTSYQRTLVDFGVWFAGGVTVPLDPDLPAAQLERILQDSGARRIFVEDAAKAGLVAEVLKTADLPVERIISTVRMDYDGDAPNLASLAAAGTGITDAELERYRSTASLADVASVVYGSRPQPPSDRAPGCRITHGNLALLAKNMAPLLPETLLDPRGRTLVFLPAASTLAMSAQLIFLSAGITVGHSTASGLQADLQSFKPGFLAAGPGILEAIYAEAARQAETAGQSRLFDSAAHTAVEYSLAVGTSDAGGPGKLLTLRHAYYDRLVYRRLRSALGGHLTHLFAAGGRLPADAVRFFDGAGIPVLEGYGRDETTGPCTINTPARKRSGTVGLPVPGTTVRVAADGEILVKGIAVSAGYYGDAAATAAAFADGFFRTGEMGSLDDDGYLTVTGPKPAVPPA